MTLRLVTAAQAEALATGRRDDAPQAIPLDRLVICADCESAHDQPGGACPRCTSRHGVLWVRLMEARASAGGAR